MAKSTQNVPLYTADFKGTLLFDQEPDWDLVAAEVRFLGRKTGIFTLPVASNLEDDGSVWVDIVGRDMSAARREGFVRDHGEESQEKARDLSPHIIATLQDNLCCSASVAPLDPKLSNPVDIQLAEKLHTLSNSGRGPAQPGELPTAESFYPKVTHTCKHDAERELDALVGMEDVKFRLKEIVAYAAKHAGADRPCLHMAFRGNPGTGKTTVARILAKMLGEAGILEHPEHFIECDRSGLVGMYVGQTAPKTLSQIEKAAGGVLFVDEAYSLGMYGDLGTGPDGSTGRHDFGDEAIATLVKSMEDTHSSFVCIMAGYTAPMDHMIAQNPGLRDRIAFYIDFPDYSPAELLSIFRRMAEKGNMQLDDAAANELEEMFAHMAAQTRRDFSNGRMARKVFERCLMRQSTMRDDFLITADVISSVFSDSDLAAELGSAQQYPIGFCA